MRDFASAGVAGDDIFVAPVRGGRPRRLTRTPNLSEGRPSWSPDGRKIAFTCGQKNEDVFSIHANGTNMRRLTTNGASDNYPAWSPDGEWIAYVAYTGEENGVWIMRSDGTDRRRLTRSTHDSALGNLAVSGVR